MVDPSCWPLLRTQHISLSHRFCSPGPQPIVQDQIHSSVLQYCPDQHSEFFPESPIISSKKNFMGLIFSICLGGEKGQGIFFIFTYPSFVCLKVLVF